MLQEGTQDVMLGGMHAAIWGALKLFRFYCPVFFLEHDTDVSGVQLCSSPLSSLDRLRRERNPAMILRNSNNSSTSHRSGSTGNMSRLKAPQNNNNNQKKKP